MQHIIRTLVAALIREWTVRQALKHLHALEGRALNDMGLNRGNLDYAVRHGREAYGGPHHRPSNQGSADLAVPAVEGRA